ncbi:hypothetical protein HZH68_001681 [Vespula germanica]|uniref:Uncharacterized protein n=1 Tax=Vespula germanica TaxID=30212 RepID=A0A834U751_VESGE|nr:hypothetical protein HZH68_001681 [Vespula germanica]
MTEIFSYWPAVRYLRKVSRRNQVSPKHITSDPIPSCRAVPCHIVLGVITVFLLLATVAVAAAVRFVPSRKNNCPELFSAFLTGQRHLADG